MKVIDSEQDLMKAKAQEGKKRVLNVWGLSAFVLAAGLLVTSFFNTYPLWTFSIFITLSLMIPEWGSNMSAIKSALAEIVPKSLSVRERLDEWRVQSKFILMGRMILHSSATIIILNRISRGFIFDRLGLGFLYQMGNGIILFLLAYIIPYLSFLFFRLLLFNNNNENPKNKSIK